MPHFSNAKWYYLALVATRNGIERTKDETGFEIICPQILDNEYRVFHDRSLIFPEADLRKIAKEVFEEYGRKLAGRNHALGYQNSQSLLGFHHNIPDNTLPVIWSEEVWRESQRWQPLFKRIQKVY